MIYRNYAPQRYTQNTFESDQMGEQRGNRKLAANVRLPSCRSQRETGPAGDRPIVKAR